MSLALYRKYRSKSFEDVVGQEHITKTLQKSVDNNTFSHAYLLTGLRGVGKTSVARIFASYVNQIQYEQTVNNPDIIEIDAASNRKIDEIRDLREKVNIAPTSLKYKVYIIDEVHMLTREAFNALLKTLEEPPKHCIFILATTDYHKLPETIISRCIRFSFRSISNEDVIGHLKEIASKEKIKIDEEALQTIAENSSGSLRDAIAILDQARNLSDQISSSDIELLLGLADKKNITSLHDLLASDDAKGLISKLEAMRNSGVNPEKAIMQFSKLIRFKISNDSASAKHLSLLEGLMSIENYSDKWLAFEVCLLKHTSLTVDSSQSEQPDVQVFEAKQTETDKKSTDNQVKTEPKTLKPATKNDLGLWQKVLDELKVSNSTLYGVARMAEANINQDSLELRLKFNFHKKQLDMKRNRLKIIEIINKHNSDITSLDTIIIKEETFEEPDKKYDSKKDISNISNVFGSAEMLE
ncbi:MAG TPA: DNA polymerase III subunit gamma/tau [Candidatus Saccharimonadales bacterium]|nr:DNA polymerase III subunit gamma/tau [Candidatus Saccharimonadales bacterium]